MSRPYNILTALPAEDYLEPLNFGTTFDSINPQHARKQYETGLKYSNEAKQIIICANGTWAANMLNGSSVTSYEGIGYHAHTISLLRGFLDGNAEIVVHRYGKEPKVIRPAKQIMENKA